MTDNSIIRKDGATVGHVQESAATIDDNGSVNIPTGETYDINGTPHTHTGLATYDSDVIFTDITTGNADSDNHGFLPKLSGDSDTYLDGAGTWGTPAGGGGGLFASYACIVDAKAQNTSGGTFTSGAWQTRDLNTEIADDDGIVSISSNQFVLGAGTYAIKISAPAFRVNQNRMRLYNISDSDVQQDVNANEMLGSSEYADNGADGSPTASFLWGEFTIAGSKTFEVQHYCATTGSTTGFGQASNQAAERYTFVEILKFT